MKKILLLLTLIFMSSILFAADINPISNAFKSGNAASLTPYFDAETDVAINGKSAKCNAAKAAELLNSFFAADKPTGFTVLHNADKNETGFVVGKLATAKKEYRVNVSYRIDGAKAIVQSVRIE